MTKTIIAASLAAALLSSVAVAQTSTSPSGGAATKMSSTDCQALWTRINTNSTGGNAAGGMTPTQAQAYVQDFKSVDTNSDGRLVMAEFMTACQGGMVRDSATTGSGSGASGTSGSSGSSDTGTVGTSGPAAKSGTGSSAPGANSSTKSP